MFYFSDFLSPLMFLPKDYMQFNFNALSIRGHSIKRLLTFSSPLLAALVPPAAAFACIVVSCALRRKSSFGIFFLHF
jgi:hypothetical protein